MVSEIIDGIKESLLAEYPNITVYVDDESAKNVPSFLITNSKSTQEQRLGPRYWCENTFDLEYFPQDQANGQAEFSSIVSDLMLVLEYIDMDGSLIRGTKMNSKVEEGRFHLFVNYDVFVLKELEKLPLMETLHQEDELKIPKED